MTPIRAIWRKLRSLGRQGTVKHEIDEELCFHIEQRVAENIAAGMSAEDAAREARNRFGNVQNVREQCRDACWAGFGEATWKDIRFGARMLRKNPGFTAVAVLTLALGIGANTAVFGLIDHVMLRLLPVRNPHELAVVKGQFSYPNYERLRDLNKVFSGIAGTHALPQLAVSIPGQSQGQATGELVSGSYFATLGVRAMLGRTIFPEDDGAPESSPVALISYSFWKRAFGGAADVLGRKINVRSGPGNAGTSGLDIYDGAAAKSGEGAILTIVGVAPPKFFGDAVGTSTDVWMPMAMEPAVMPGRPWLDKSNVTWITILGRRIPGISQDQAAAALTVLWRQLLSEEAGANLTEDRKRSIAQEVLKVESGEKGFDQLRGQFSQPLEILMAIVAMVLLIACLNVANLLVARGAARRREIGVRLALGAGRARLIRQSLTESLLLGALGGAFGLLLAFAGTRVLVALVSSGDQPIELPLRPDFRALGFTAALSLLTTILFGLAPALGATRIRVTDTLKDAAHGTANGQRGGTGKLLVVVQVAVAIVLLISASLFLRTFYNLRTQDVGYNPESLVMIQLDPISAGYRGDDIGRVCKTVLDRVAALPGVRSATFSENGLFSGTESSTRVAVEGFMPDSEEGKFARFDQVGPGYFSNVGIPLLLGRGITERDGPSSPRVAVINETMAKFYFPGGNPIGKRLYTRLQKIPLEIVGVARDTQDHSFWEKPVRRFYVSYFQPIDGITVANFEIRVLGNAAEFAGIFRREVQAVDRQLMILRIRDLKSLMDESLVQTRLITKLTSFFGLLAVLLAAIGLYGVMAYEVGRRTREFGIRMAIGAQRKDVLCLVIGKGLKLVFVGSLIGLAGATAATRLVSSLLYGVTATDPMIFAGVFLLMPVVALLALWLPARRATRVHPMAALRHE
jgi:predicted permease